NVMKNLKEWDLKVLDASESVNVTQCEKYSRWVFMFLFYFLSVTSPSMLHSQNIEGVKRASTNQKVQIKPFSQQGKDSETNQDKTNFANLTPQILQRKYDWSIFDSPLARFFNSLEFFENTYDSGLTDCYARCASNLSTDNDACENNTDETEKQNCYDDGQARLNACIEGCEENFRPPL